MQLSAIFLRTKIWSEQPFPALNPACSSRILWSTAILIRFKITRPNILIGIDIKVIPRELLLTEMSPFFGIFTIKPFFQSSRSHTSLRKGQRTQTDVRKSPFFVSCWNASVCNRSISACIASIPVVLQFLRIWWRPLSLWPSMCSRWSPGLWKQVEATVSRGKVWFKLFFEVLDSPCRLFTIGGKQDAWRMSNIFDVFLRRFVFSFWSASLSRLIAASSASIAIWSAKVSCLVWHLSQLLFLGVVIKVQTVFD